MNGECTVNIAASGEVRRLRPIDTMMPCRVEEQTEWNVTSTQAGVWQFVNDQAKVYEAVHPGKRRPKSSAVLHYRDPCRGRGEVGEAAVILSARKVTSDGKKSGASSTGCFALLSWQLPGGTAIPHISLALGYNSGSHCRSQFCLLRATGLLHPYLTTKWPFCFMCQTCSLSASFHAY
jgi:hypothetical protein